jgi:hypothetical protein
LSSRLEAVRKAAQAAVRRRARTRAIELRSRRKARAFVRERSAVLEQGEEEAEIYSTPDRAEVDNSIGQSVYRAIAVLSTVTVLLVNSDRVALIATAALIVALNQLTG